MTDDSTYPQDQQEAPKPNPDLQALDRLVGIFEKKLLHAAVAVHSNSFQNFLLRQNLGNKARSRCQTSRTSKSEIS